MRVFGKLKYKNEIINCSLIISNGKIYELDITDTGSFDFISNIKEHSEDYVLEKIIDTKNSPANSNYFLKYFGGYKKPSLIYLKLNWFEKCKLDFAMKQTLVQSKDIKIELVKYSLTIVISFVSGIIYEKSHSEIATPATTPKNEPITGTKSSLDTKILKIDNKKDTIIINNLKNTSHLKGGETKPE
ncbi:hypothetical protein [Flavobacterium franklandianum]|uniref:Uncharacterized protein n=1 Tax=Flavobacterium franklandianum TaxID=2594430 RepID=A0A553C5S5_9FLAO|nr:hypothetical protein [Flavobacterium franklandianum]TRX15889.1 hypothetical protein FNW17_15845 [Flavobacterium franklandianum]